MASIEVLDPEQRVTVVQAVAAYRDRWGITAASPIGAIPSDDAQRADYERTQIALDSIVASSKHTAPTPIKRGQTERAPR